MESTLSHSRSIIFINLLKFVYMRRIYLTFVSVIVIYRMYKYIHTCVTRSVTDIVPKRVINPYFPCG